MHFAQYYNKYTVPGITYCSILSLSLSFISLCLSLSVSPANEEMNIRYKELRRVQPDGQMTWVILHRDLPGYHSDNTLQISFIFPDGVQTVRIQTQMSILNVLFHMPNPGWCSCFFLCR